MDDSDDSRVSNNLSANDVGNFADESSELNSSSEDNTRQQTSGFVSQKAVFGSDTESEVEFEDESADSDNDQGLEKSNLHDNMVEEDNRDLEEEEKVEESIDHDESEESDLINDVQQSTKSEEFENDFALDSLGDGRSVDNEIDDNDDEDKDPQLADIIDDVSQTSGVDDGFDVGEGDQEPDETRISVDFPLIRADLGREMHLVKMPNFLSVETRPFDPNYYEDELDEDEIMDEEGRTRLKLKVENTIRWRIGKTPDGELIHESNARIVRWSDGSLSLHLGDEIFDIHKLDIQSDYNYLFIREGSGLQGQSSLKTKLTFRPHSTDSFTHRKITLSLADKTNKSQKVKILPVAGTDPEKNRNMLVRKEEEKLRATLRRENQLRRMREKQAMTRNVFGSDKKRNYAAEEDDDEYDENTTSLNAVKRGFKNSFAPYRKDVSAVYSSDSDNLSESSELNKRKKLRAKISDEESD